MKRLAVLLAAVLIVGRGSPSLADDLTGKWFLVDLLDDVSGLQIDSGVFHFWVNQQDGYKKLDHGWFCSGGGWHTYDREMNGDYRRYGSAWGAWPEDGHKGLRQDCRYYEFDWFYCKPWGKLIGHAYWEDDLGEPRKYALYGEPW